MPTELATLANYIRECTDCPLHRKCRKRVPGVGKESAVVMFVGQGPGIEEDHEGLPWIGQAGQWLSELVEVMGLHSSRIFWTNIIKCFPGRRKGGDNEPPPYAVAECRKYLEKEIGLVQPEIIVAVGAFSMKWFGIKGGIRQNGGRIFDTPYGRVIPILHPAGIFRRMSEAPILSTQLNSILTFLEGASEIPPWIGSTNDP